MTWWHTHPDAAGLVRRHWKDAELVLVAQRQPCIRIRDEELAAIRRVTRASDAAGLGAWARGKRRRPSWMVAVLVCEGDDLAPLVSVVREAGLDAGRFHFYLHRDAPVTTLRPWTDAGFPLDAVDTGISGWVALHKLLGLDFNIRIVEDFAGAP